MEARKTVPGERVWVQRMEELDLVGKFDLICSLSWTVHYCGGPHELEDVLSRIWRALSPEGTILLQVAHGPNLEPGWREDTETGPGGRVGDITLRYRFQPSGEDGSSTLAEYQYRCESEHEYFSESHLLKVTNVHQIERLCTLAGFENVELWNSWRKEPFGDSGSAWVVARKSRGPR